MIDWLAISLALGIIAALVGVFGVVAWKINMSDPLLADKKEELHTLVDSEKKKKEKSTNDQSKRKRKDSKKTKQENKDEEQQQQQQHVVKFKEPATQTSEETDNEREESEQELSTLPAVETASKARKRRNKQRTTSNSSDQLEGILANKNEKSPVTTRPERISHPKLAHMKPKDEVELAKQHQQQQQSKAQGKSTQSSTKQTAPSTAPVQVKKSGPSATDNSQGNQRQQQQQQQKQEKLLQEQQEQPFTTVGSRHKPATTAGAAQQQNKSANVNSTTTTTTTTTPAPTPPQPQLQQQPTPVQVSHEHLAQRQPQPARQQKEPAIPVNGFNTQSTLAKQPAVPPAAPPARPAPTKLADLVKALPSSQIVVSELVSALDAFPLSTDELDIILHKIANKQSVLKQDWTKLQHGQKVDPQAHIGQVLDESARAHQEDMKSNAIKHIKELRDELSNDKSHISELMNEMKSKDATIQALRGQMNAFQHPTQQLQTYQAELSRLREENMQLTQRLSQQQHFSPMNLLSNANNNSEPSDMQFRVLSEQVKKLSVDNGTLEKQLKSKDANVKELQKEKEDLLRAHQQLVQKSQENQKQFQLNEEKVLKELNDNRTLNMNQFNDLKRRNEQLESENEQARQAAATINNHEREETEQHKHKLESLQIHENELKQEIEQLKKSSEQVEQLNNELASKNTQLESLKAQVEELKATNDSNRNLQQKQILTELLPENQRKQLTDDTQDFDQWLTAYKQVFESSQRTSHEETAALKRENDQLHKNMSDIESQLKEIEQTVQSKEELLLADLKSKDATLENLQHENTQLDSELNHLRTEIDRLQSATNSAENEIRALKVQLDEQHLANTTNPSTTAVDSYELIKQPSPPPSEIDTRVEELNELIRSSKEALENQDSIAQQLDKHLSEMHRGGTGEASTSNADEAAVSPASSDQPEFQS